ncbi:MAG: hypothetical protein FWG87_10555 [Defluviitaleaceae bacterium]|nr:hypothetical protein [Defluviitaleaceae bacterium]
MVFVGDGFIRPEVRTFVNSGQVTSINAERGNLGADKSAPYVRTDMAMLVDFRWVSSPYRHAYVG